MTDSVVVTDLAQCFSWTNPNGFIYQTNYLQCLSTSGYLKISVGSVSSVCGPDPTIASAECCASIVSATECQLDNAKATACKELLDSIVFQSYSCEAGVQEYIGFISFIGAIFLIFIVGATLLRYTSIGALMRKNLILARQGLIRSFLSQLFELLLVGIMMGTILGISGMDVQLVSLGLFNVYLQQPDNNRLMIYQNLRPFGGLFFIIIFIYPIASMAVAFVREKETRMKEAMRMAGLRSETLHISWLLTFFLIYLPLTVGASVMSKYGAIFPNTSISLTFLLFNGFIFAMSGVAHFMSILFHQTRPAAVFTIFVTFAMYIASFTYLNTDDVNEQRNGCWIPPVGLSLGINLMFLESSWGEGFSYAIASAENAGIYKLSLEEIIWRTWLTGLVYNVISWYLDLVIPQMYGVPRRPDFLLEPLYRLVRHLIGMCKKKSVQKDVVFKDSVADVENHPTADAAVIVQNLRKVYKSHWCRKGVVAVDDISLTMNRGEITALLGPNGAGKSTTFSVLTGILKPTGGDVHILGYSIRSEMHKIRGHMGWCPQHDILYPTLTVRQHLELFSALRGRKVDWDDTNIMLAELAISEKIDYKAKNLSGGQRRKLCLMIALIGDTDVVFLDEASAGVDPNSRRHMWNVLQNQRKRRAIVMTTHFMDEADMLADKVAIISHGNLCCVGTSLELKQAYATGYRLCVSSPSASREAITALINQEIYNAEFVEVDDDAYVFRLPFDSPHLYPKLLRRLEYDLGCKVEITISALEEVFLKVAEASATEKFVDSDEMQPYVETKRKNPRIFCALFMKRFLYAMRDWKLFSLVLILPLLFTLSLFIIPTIRLFSIIYDSPGALAPRGTSACEAYLANDQWRYTSSSPFDNYTSSMDFTGFTCCVFPTNPTTAQKQFFAQCIAVMPQCITMTKLAAITGKQSCMDSYAYCAAAPWICDVQSCCDPANYLSPYYPCQSYVELTETQIFTNTLGEANFNNFCPTYTISQAQGFVNALIKTLVLLMGFVFPIGPVIAFAIMEKEEGRETKFQQIVNGVGLVRFWLGAAMWDHLILILPVIPVPFIVYYAPSAAINSSIDSVLQVTALTLAFVSACVSLSYAMSFMYKQHATGLIGIIVLNILTGGLIALLVYVLEVINVDFSNGINSYDISQNYIQYVFNIFPGFAFSHGILNIQTSLYKTCVQPNVNTALRCTSFGTDVASYYQKVTSNADMSQYTAQYKPSWNDTIINLIYLGGVYVLSWFIVIIAESKPSCRCTDPPETRTRAMSRMESSRLSFHVDFQDQHLQRMESFTREMVINGKMDVMQEENRVCSQTQDAVQLLGLSKQYGKKKKALRNMWLGIQKGECFGYLGVNGAGKSTTIKILTGEIKATDGDATILGQSVTTDIHRARREVGYTPQFDALYDLLTVEEHLSMYAKIRGLSDVKSAVDKTIVRMQLVKFRKSLAKELSGGNKRKLSAGIAMLGNPKVIILDEPSSGMDPHAQRFMWSVIADTVNRTKCAVMLTSHSLPEVDALCGRIGIVIDGRLRCIGTGPYLKKMYGRGYDVEISLEDLYMSMPVPEQYLEDGVYVTLSNLAAIGTMLGDEDRVHDAISDHSPLAGDFRNKKCGNRVTWEEFSQWWALESRISELLKFLSDNWGERAVVIKDKCRNSLSLSVSNKDVNLADMFELLEQNKTRFVIRNYSISQSGLEEIFNRWVEDTTGLEDDDGLFTIM